MNWSGRNLGLVVLLFAVPALLFALYTDNRWEDFYITFRSSKNLVLGRGLVFTEGERLHTFTSPIGVLLPALCSWLTGIDHDDAALWLFRVMSIAALAGAGVLVYAVLERRGLSALVAWTTLALLALDAKTVMFTVNGQEIAFVILALSVSIYALIVPSERTWLLLGVAWGGIMWARPDGFVYAVAVALGVWAFGAGLTETKGRGWLVRQYVLAAGLGAAIYLPWFAWSWWYYGTPVPHTVVAKGLHYTVFDWTNFIAGFYCTSFVYTPTYAQYGGWGTPTAIWGYGLYILTLMPLVVPRVSRLARAFSAAFFLASIYLDFIAPYPFPWYLPVEAWMGYLALGLFVHDLTFDEKGVARGGFLGGVKFSRSCLATAAALVLVQLSILGCVLVQIGAQQQLIEFGQRKAIGFWLKAHAATTHDTVFVECLGYIGYYSNLKMYDFPGMSSDEVVRARRDLNTDKWAPLIKALQPDWLVLRPGEIRKTYSEDGTVFSNYVAVRVFDCSKAVEQLSFPGRTYLELDDVFVVFHRKS